MNDLDRLKEMQALKREIASSIHCALPGTVESFNAESRTAVIRPALKSRLVSSRPDSVSRVIPGEAEGSPSSVSLPLLRDVPVFMPVAFDIAPGDKCLVVFADREVDGWLETGEVSAPRSDRMHSLSDGFAFVGFGRGGDGE